MNCKKCLKIWDFSVMSSIYLFIFFGSPKAIPKNEPKFGEFPTLLCSLQKNSSYFLGIPNPKMDQKFWDSQLFYRGCTANFWNSPIDSWCAIYHKVVNFFSSLQWTSSNQFDDEILSEIAPMPWILTAKNEYINL